MCDQEQSAEGNRSRSVQGPSLPIGLHSEDTKIK